MARVKTFANGGTLLPGDLNSIEDDYETTFSSYSDTGLVATSGFLATIQTSGIVYLIGMGGTPIATPSGNGSQAYTFIFNPSDYTAGTRITKIRLRHSLTTNGTASGVTFTAGLYPIVTVTGGASASTSTVGAVVTGTTAAFASPAINSGIVVVTSDITAPSNGLYGIGVTLSGTAATGSFVNVRSNIQIRQV